MNQSQVRRQSTIYIVDDLETWNQIEHDFHIDTDLVATFDFGLQNLISNLGGKSVFIDSICDVAFLQENNYVIRNFLREWTKSESQTDLFSHRGVDFGPTLKIEIWSEIVYLIRIWLSVNELIKFPSNTIVVATQSQLLIDVLKHLNINFRTLPYGEASKSFFYFPMHQWLKEKLSVVASKPQIFQMLLNLRDRTFLFWDRITDRLFPRKLVFVHEYHPTYDLIKALLEDPSYNVCIGDISRQRGLFSTLLKDRPIPRTRTKKSHLQSANQIYAEYLFGRRAEIICSDGSNPTNLVNSLIENKLRFILPEYIRDIESTLSFWAKRRVSIVVLISNIGKMSSIVQAIAKSTNVPTFLIINGLLEGQISDESRDATVINCYGESIREHYFLNTSNSICLGDPRMDVAIRSAELMLCNRKLSPQLEDEFLISIGASGFNSIDLNSYAAIEFCFLHEVLTAVGRTQITKNSNIKINLKIRPNGYRHQYEKFIAKYFPNLSISIFDKDPMASVFKGSNIYISTCSQTLFEASVFGIPVVYYQNDTEIHDPPFDGSGKLVIAKNIDQLAEFIDKTVLDSTIFNGFISRTEMEKYIGPLDGKCLERNLDFLKSMIDTTYTPSGNY
jgi:hypothetical protein